MPTKEIAYIDDEFSCLEDEPTLREAVELYGEEFVRATFVDNLRYRNKHPRVYKRVSGQIARKFPKATVTKTKSKNGAKVVESDINHIRRYIQTGSAAHSEVEKLISDAVLAEPLFVKGERGGGGQISEKALESANLFLAQGPEVVAKTVATIEAQVPGYSIPREPDGSITPEALARGIQKLNKHLEKQLSQQRKALIGV